MAKDLSWSTAFQGPNPQQDPDPIKSVQPDLSPQQDLTVITQEGWVSNALWYKLYVETYLSKALHVLRNKLEAVVKRFWPLLLKSYAYNALPSAAVAGQLIFVWNASPSSIPAFSDGTNWRRVDDRSIITGP